MPRSKIDPDAPDDTFDIEDGFTQSHYESHKDGDSYEDAYFYQSGSEYMQWLVKHSREKLGLEDENTTERRILDVGGGTGNFTKALIEGMSSWCKGIVLDPYLTRDAMAKPNQPVGLSFVPAPAEILMTPAREGETWRTGGYHQVMFKEVIHHLKDRVKLYQGLAENLIPLEGKPSILLITRPQTDLDYPFWPAAREVWAKQEPSLAELTSELKEAGFVNISHEIHAYPCHLPWKQWIEMVQTRCWSTFGAFNDDEIEAACKALDEMYKDRIDEDGSITFEDRLIFLTAYKS